MHNASSFFSGLKIKHLLAGACLFALISYALQVFIKLERNSIEQNLRALVTEEATSHILKLETELNSNIYLVNGLVAYIHSEQELEEAKVQVALKALYEFGTHLRNVGVAPDNRLTYVYPIEGNEGALGLYYPENPAQWPAVKQAIEARETLLAGPLELMQGGSGLISRTPVFIGDNHYWGILSLVLDADAVFAAAGIQPETEHLKIALRKIDPFSNETQVFMGDGELFNSDSVFVSIEVPGATWELAAEPLEGWSSLQGGLDKIQTIGLFVASLVVFFMLIFLRDQFRIESSRKRLETILNTTQDGVIVFNSQGRVTESNPSAELMLGYTEEKFLNMHISQFLEQESGNDNGRENDADTFDLTLLNDSTHLVGKKQNGVKFPVEISVGKTRIDTEIYYISTLKDISDRKNNEEQLRVLATTDSLTSTMNRRAIMEVGNSAFKLAKRYDRPFSVMMIDADFFKKVNDDYGHDSGDQVLIALSRTIDQELRNSDYLARFGGEEFLVVLPETSMADAEDVAQRLLKKVREIIVLSPNKEAIHITVSIGLSEITPNSNELEDIIKCADVALFEAKQTGRDRVVCKPRTNAGSQIKLIADKKKSIGQYSQI